MERDEHQRGVHECLVQILDPLGAPEGIRRHHEPCDRDGGQRRHKSEHHHPAGRIMPEIARRPHPDCLPHVGEHGFGRSHEIAEPGVRGADKAPNSAQQQKASDGVPRREMQPFDLVSGCEGEGKQGGQTPVEDAHERVPDAHHRAGPGGRCRRHNAAGPDRIVADGHNGYCLPTISPEVGSRNSSVRAPL